MTKTYTAWSGQLLSTVKPRQREITLELADSGCLTKEQEMQLDIAELQLRISHTSEVIRILVKHLNLH